MPPQNCEVGQVRRDYGEIYTYKRIRQPMNCQLTFQNLDKSTDIYWGNETHNARLIYFVQNS